MTDELREHQKFVDSLDQSAEAVFKCAKYLYGKGMQVAIAPMFKCKDWEDRHNCMDDGDLFIQQRIEVKGLTAEFTNASNWPFGADFIVCAAKTYDRAKPKPYAYMILNKAQTHAAIVYCKTRPYWRKKTITDRRYTNMTQIFYLCPLEHIEWRPLNER